MVHPNHLPPCHSQSGATLGQDLATGDSETSQPGPSEHFEHASHISSGNRPTPLEGWGGHWEVIFFCLRLSKRRPRRQLSNNSDSEAVKGREARPSSPTSWGSQMSGLGVCGGRFLPSSVHRLPEAPTLGF